MHSRLSSAPLVGLVSFLAGTTVAAVVVPDQAVQSPAFTVINYMKTPPGGAANYLQLERELYQPFHQERIRAGRMTGWDLYQVRFPGGADAEYNFVTISTFANFADIDRNNQDIRDRVTPGVTDVGARTAAARTSVRTELWTRLESVR